MRKHAIDINRAKLTVHCNKYELYEMGKFMVYKFTVQFTATLLSLTIKLKVYSTLDSLQQIVVTYKSLTVSYYNLALLAVCFSTTQRAFYTVYMYKKNMLLRRNVVKALIIDALESHLLLKRARCL